MREFIPEQLWIGNHRDLCDIRGVLSCGIMAVIDLAIEEQPAVYPREMIYCRYPLVDGEGNSASVLLATIQAAIAWVAGGVPTLIGCSAGQSRSPCIAAAVLSHVERKTPDEALLRILSNGPHDVAPSLWADVKMVLRLMAQTDRIADSSPQRFL